MKTNPSPLRRLLGAALLALAATAASGATPAPGPLSRADEAFLRQYASVHAALVQDDLAAARQAAAAIKDPAYAADAAKVAGAADLPGARRAFQALSREAVDVARGHAGYHVAFCPMVPDHAGYWIQTSTQIANPYMGGRMPGCGSIVD